MTVTLGGLGLRTLRFELPRMVPKNGVRRAFLEEGSVHIKEKLYVLLQIGFDRFVSKGHAKSTNQDPEEKTTATQYMARDQGNNKSSYPGCF